MVHRSISQDTNVLLSVLTFFLYLLDYSILLVLDFKIRGEEVRHFVLYRKCSNSIIFTKKVSFQIDIWHNICAFVNVRFIQFICWASLLRILSVCSSYRNEKLTASLIFDEVLLWIINQTEIFLRPGRWFYHISRVFLRIFTCVFNYFYPLLEPLTLRSPILYPALT